MAIVPEVPKHQTRLDAEELLDLDATRSDAKDAEEAEKPEEKPKKKHKEEMGIGEPSKTEAEYLKILRASVAKFSAMDGKEATVARIQAEINAIMARNQTTDSNNQ